MRPLTEQLMTTQGRIERIASIIDEMKGERITLMKIGAICDFTDAFILTTVRSSTHMQALVNTIMERLREEGLRPLAMPDPLSPRWSVLDYGDVVVHFLDPEARDYYAIEALWGDAEFETWPSAELTKP